LKSLKVRKSAGSWLELGLILRNNGDFENAGLAFKNESDRSWFGYLLKYNENKLDELSPTNKLAKDKRYQCAQILLKRNYTGLLQTLKQIEPDSTILHSEIQMFQLYAYYGLKQDDSVKMLASQFPEDDAYYFHRTLSSNIDLRPQFLKTSLLTGKSKLRDFIESDNKQFRQDPMMQCFYEIREMQVAVLVKDFKGATERLAAMNKNYPAFGDYSWLNRPEFDRIKEEYPPFVETMNNLKFPPKLSQIELINM
jgi:hypothetical protein